MKEKLQRAPAILDRWEQLASRQKILIIIIGLIASGIAITLIYPLIFAFFANIRTNPSEASESQKFLSTVEPTTDLLVSDPHIIDISLPVAGLFSQMNYLI
jgi:hypothetical protein